MIKEIAQQFLNFCFERQTLSFSRININQIVENKNVSERVKQLITTQILDFMKSEKIIKEDIVKTAIYSYRNKPLFSYDYGSFNLLMAKNGYKRYLGKWENTQGYPTKHKVGTYEFGEKFSEDLQDDDFDIVEIRSKKSQNTQGCYANSNMSVVRDFCYSSAKKVYSIVQTQTA